jgi:hypothetical protein
VIAGSCCEVHANPFCNDADCCNTVCAQLPECCADSWTQPCVDLAFQLCPKLTDCLPDTCQGFCGGQSSGGCFCDTACCLFGDCCEDVSCFCPVGCANGATCQGSCGGQSADGCFCDDACFGFSDCCPGTCEFCPQLRGCGGPGVCTGDFNVDGVVKGEDLGQTLLNWGACCVGTCCACCGVGSICPQDFDYSGIVDGEDLGLLLLNWGECRE